jgi:hypothetical protein
MSQMTLEQKKLLEPFGCIFSEISLQVRGLDTDALQKMLDACDAASATNCWCFTFEAAQYLQREVRRQIHQRRQAAIHKDQ